MSYLKTLNSAFDFFDDIKPQSLFYGILAFCWIMYLWETYLEFRQYFVEKNNTKVPLELESVTDETTFTKSRLYSLDKRKFSLVNDLYQHLEGLAILLFGGIPFVWNLTGAQLSGFESEWIKSEISQSLLFIVYSTLFSTVTNLPWSIYSTFVIEEKYGFNKQTMGFFVKDNIKKLLVNLVLSIPITGLLLYIIKAGGEYFFVYAWLFVAIVSLFLVSIFADFIAPLFDKYTLLPDGDLRTKIESLAKSVGFPLYKLYVVEGSKRSDHSNAYFYGFYKFKRIVLFDTLIEGYTSTTSELNEKMQKEVVDQAEVKESKKGCSTDEILAVLAHELGHWKLSHNLQNMIIGQINMFFYFLIFGVLMNRQVFYLSFGIFDSRPTIIGFIIIMQFIFAPYNEIVQFSMTALCRRFEFQADAFAKKLQKAEYLRAALIKLHKDNLTFPIADWLYSTWHYSHPPLLERLRALDDKYKSD